MAPDRVLADCGGERHGGKAGGVTDAWRAAPPCHLPFDAPVLTHRFGRVRFLIGTGVRERGGQTLSMQI